MDKSGFGLVVYDKRKSFSQTRNTCFDVTTQSFTTYTHRNVRSALCFMGPFHYGCHNYHIPRPQKDKHSKRDSHLDQRASSSLPSLSAFMAGTHIDLLVTLVSRFHSRKIDIYFEEKICSNLRLLSRENNLSV